MTRDEESGSAEGSGDPAGADHRIVVRHAGHGDDDALRSLWELVVPELRSFRGGEDLVHDLAEVLDAARGASSDTASLRLVAEVSGVVVGGAIAELQSRADGRVACCVRVLATDPALRGVGVGDRLLRAVDAWAGDRSASCVEVVALPGDRATKNFLEAHGLVAHLLVTRRSTGGSPAG